MEATIEQVNGKAETNPFCGCAEDGHCERYNRRMVGRLRAICRGEACDPGEAAQYRALWLAEAGHQVPPPSDAVCPHRTAEPLQENGLAKLRACESCNGKVSLKVFGCNHPALSPHEATYQDCAACDYRPRVTTGARALILRNRLCPGDVLVMSAAIYCLHRAHPGKFLTAVDTTAMQLWEHNPDVVATDALANLGATTLDCHYPAVNRSNQEARHFLSGYVEYLADALGVKIPLATNRPHVYLSKQEKSWMGQVEEVTGKRQPYWIVCAGTKRDYTTKRWGHDQYQKVVDLLRGKVLFAQIGEAGHDHKPLRGVVNLIGKTDTRQLVRLGWHAEGGVGGVSFPMHLMAALEKPFVAIMGGREPQMWNTYPRGTLLHTVGALDCCRSGGCWKSRVTALGDGDEKDKSLCDFPVPGDEPVGRCMAMISPEEVANAILRYAS